MLCVYGIENNTTANPSQVTIDYIQPASDNFPEKTACTVMMGEQNIAEQLLLRGLATCIRYRADDDHRSPHYDTLLAAQAQAEKEHLRLHSLTKDAGSDAPKKKNQERACMRVQDITGDATKSKQFFPSMQRAGRSDAVVEFVASGSRLRIYVPRETCLMTLLLAGIQCPRTARPAGAGKRFLVLLRSRNFFLAYNRRSVDGGTVRSGGTRLCAHASTAA